ncbi:MAG: 16S rRNA (uracil(1498)-N(3))-methyltransferase [Granulosicoccus sp.]|nr:16S rRNA (uracil(1498)-N(3))-methyltransferase [Granulosicoccus sp.]
MRKRLARIPRFFISVELSCNQELLLDKKTSHHLLTVLRAKKGDSLRLFNGDGYDYQATVLHSGHRSPGKKAILQLHQRQLVSNESELNITLLQCISRADRMDSTLRQAVELGVSNLQPLYSAHSASPLEEGRTKKRQDHWQKIVISACEQSGRARLPSLAPARSLQTAIEDLSAKHHWQQSVKNGHCLPVVLSPAADQSLMKIIEKYTQCRSKRPEAVYLLNGPESGLDPQEISMGISAGMLEAHMGPRILRTETAGTAAITMIHTCLDTL